MHVRVLILSLQALVVSILMSVNASAVVVNLNADDPTVFSLVDGIDYLAGEAFSSSVTTSDTYHFSAGNSAAEWEGSANTIGAFTTLTAEWYDVTDSTQVTLTNLLTSSGTFMVSLVAGHLYDLIITVTTSTSGQHFYGLAISAVPLPPAVLLLVSGLLGIGALGRRRRGVTTVKV